MKIKWLIQDIGKTQMLKDNFETLHKMGANYQGFGLIGGTSLIVNLETILTDLDESYIIRGGTKILHLLEKYSDIECFCPDLNEFQLKNKEVFFQKLKNAIFYDSELFDQAYYSQLNLPLLNKEAFFLPIKDNKETTFNKPYFLKPSKDLKTFIPGILEPGQTIQKFIENSQHLKDYDHELALLSEVKIIYKEYRFFIVDTNVITGSQYKNGDKIEYNSYIPEDVLKVASTYCQLYQPHDIFTMDLAETPEGVKIVEYNCWNGSGLYHCDKVLLFNCVQEFIKNAPKKCITVTKKIT